MTYYTIYNNASRAVNNVYKIEKTSSQVMGFPCPLNDYSQLLSFYLSCAYKHDLLSKPTYYIPTLSYMYFEHTHESSASCTWQLGRFPLGVTFFILAEVGSHPLQTGIRVTRMPFVILASAFIICGRM